MNLVATLEAFRKVELKMDTIVLRRFTQADVGKRYQNWLLDDEVTQFLDVSFSDKSIDALKRFVAAAELDPYSSFYLIVSRHNNEPIGTAKLAIEPTHMIGNYGYLIGERSWWGSKAAIETQVALLDLAFNHLGVHRIYGGAHNENVMSQFNFKALGFKKEGTFRQHVRKGPGSNQYADVVYYGLLSGEWEKISHKFESCRDTRERQL